MEAFLLALITRAPEIAAAIVAALAKKGLVTADQVAEYVSSWPEAGSFFAGKKP